MEETIIFFLLHKANFIGSLGLVLDVAGVIILFFYGLPSKLHMPPKLLISDRLEEDELADNKKIKFWANTGLILIAIGFTLQLISLWSK